MPFYVTCLPPHLTISILKKVDILSTVQLAATCTRVNDLLAISSKDQLDRVARLVHLQKKYIKYSGRVAYWSSGDRVAEALQGKIHIELVFQKQTARAERYHEVVTEMKIILQGIQPGSRKTLKEKLLLFVEKHQPTKKMGEVSIQRIKDA